MKKTLIAILILFASLFLFSVSDSTRLMNVIFDIRNQSHLPPEEQFKVPFVMSGNGESPSVVQYKVSLKENTSYAMAATVSGLPEVRLDFFGNNYDAIEQELVMPEGQKDNYNFQARVNSLNIPAGDIYFRAFFTGNDDVTIHNLLLYEMSIKNTLVRYASLVLFGFSIILFLTTFFQRKNRI